MRGQPTLAGLVDVDDEQTREVQLRRARYPDAVGLLRDRQGRVSEPEQDPDVGMRRGGDKPGTRVARPPVSLSGQAFVDLRDPGREGVADAAAVRGDDRVEGEGDHVLGTRAGPTRIASPKATSSLPVHSVNKTMTADA